MGSRDIKKETKKPKQKKKKGVQPVALPTSSPTEVIDKTHRKDGE
jgi:hypothetical protein